MRKIIRKIHWKPFGITRRTLQKCFYLLIGALGESIFFILRLLKIFKKPVSYEKQKVKNILIMRPDRIGDVILATPTFEALRRSFPDAHIALLVSCANKDLVIENPYINTIYCIRHRGLIRNLGVLRRLRKKGFDLAVILYPVMWCNLLAFFSKIPIRVGYNFHGNGFLLTKKVPFRLEKEIKHEVEVNLNIVRAIGVEPKEKRLHVSTTQAAEGRIAEFLLEYGVKPEDFVVIIHPGSFKEYIRWSLSGFAEVGARIMKRFEVKVIILGGPGEEVLVSNVVAMMPKRPIKATGLTLSQIVSLIKIAGLFVGNSTGPMHIAAALGVRVVTIFGNEHPLDSYQKWGPYGDIHKVVHKDMRCRTCHPADCRDYRCMKSITADEVFSACLEQIKKVRD